MSGLNFYALSLSRLDHSFDEHLLYGALAPFATSIRQTTDAIERAQTEGDTPYEDFFLDSDLDLIETHLGCSFVTCQVFITAVVSRVKALHQVARDLGASPPTTTIETKPAIMAFGNATVLTSPFTRIQVIDAFANYFKHRDQWGCWTSLDKQSAQTCAVIIAVGAREGSTGNLRSGAEALGNASYTDVEHFGYQLLAWKNALHAAYQNELRARGLIR